MQFSQEHSNATYVIKSYQAGVIRIIQPVTEELIAAAENEPHRLNELRHFNIQKSAVISPYKLLDNWAPRSVEDMQSAHIEEILELNPEVVIIGTGERTQWPHPQVMQPLISRGIGYEVMTTAAACRTYNVLMHEDRNVAAAVML